MWLAHAFALGLRSETLTDSCKQKKKFSQRCQFLSSHYADSYTKSPADRSKVDKTLDIT